MEQKLPHQKAAEGSEKSASAEPPIMPNPYGEEFAQAHVSHVLRGHPLRSQQAMPEQRSEQPIAPDAGPPPSTTALVLKSQIALQQCPSCGASQPTSTSICLACGAYLPTKAQLIRCRRCGTQAPAALVICPGCGRELRAARRRSLSWLAPIGLIVLFLLVLQQASRLTSLEWPREQFAAGRQWVMALGEQLDPQITIETIPAETAPSLAVGSATQAESVTTKLNSLADLTLFATPVADAAAMPDASITTLKGALDSEMNAPAASVSGDTAVAAEPQQSTPVETSQAPQVNEEVPVSATATVAPTPTAPPATPTSAPTLAAPVLAPTARPTPTPIRATATATAVPTKRELAPAASGGVLAASALAASPTPTGGDGLSTKASATAVILQPTATDTEAADTPTATPAPPTATPTPSTLTYKIQAGDTPLEIAARYEIGVGELMAANGLTVDDARRLRVGQELVIPLAASDTQVTASPTAPPASAPATSTTASVPPTATPVPPTATPASAIRLDVPQLRSPEIGSSLSCGGDNSLVWLPVNFMREDDRYLLHLGFLNGYNTDGAETIVWVLEQQMLPNATIWRMDEGLCSLAPQNYGRQWRWYVEVVEPAGDGWQAVSLPSSIWTFSWN